MTGGGGGGGGEELIADDLFSKHYRLTVSLRHLIWKDGS